MEVRAMTVPLTKPAGSPCKAPALSEDLALNKKKMQSMTMHACKSTWVCSISIFAKRAIDSFRIVMFTGKLVRQS